MNKFANLRTNIYYECKLAQNILDISVEFKCRRIAGTPACMCPRCQGVVFLNK